MFIIRKFIRSNFLWLLVSPQLDVYSYLKFRQISRWFIICHQVFAAKQFPCIDFRVFPNPRNEDERRRVKEIMKNQFT